MKEIDLLPKWYKSGRRRQFSYRTQYAVLGGIFMIMVVWNFAVTYSISKAEAELEQLQSEVLAGENNSVVLDRIESELAGLKKKTNVLQDIDSKIDVPKVLAEISFLVDEKVVLRNVEFNAEKFVDEQARNSSGSFVVRAADKRPAGKHERLLGDVRFKVKLNGVSSDASGVADLMCRLEDSPYFCQVILLFSRNTSVKNDSPLADGFAKARDVSETKEDYQVSEFEISCYLANYRQEQEPVFAKEVSGSKRKR
jgi:Tfp pilus assembly protein PilN